MTLGGLSSRDGRRYGRDIRRHVKSVVDLSGVPKLDITDVRKQVVIRNCLLCGAFTRLRLSHVYPSWAGEAHRVEGGFIVGRQPHDPSRTIVSQDLPKHYLLCGSCEQFVGESEKYVRTLARGDMGEMARAGMTYGVGNVVSGVRYELLMRFAASILLRFHGAASQPEIRLPRAVARELRKSILLSRYPVRRYRLLVVKLVTLTPGANARALVAQGFGWRRRVPAHGRLEIVVGGVYMLFQIVPRWKTHVVRDYLAVLEQKAIPTSGALRIDVLPLQQIMIAATVFGVPFDESADQPWRRLTGDEPCPCGWTELPMKACCGNTWLA